MEGAELRAELASYIGTTIVFSASEFEAACDACEGVCLGCGESTSSGVEPDARGYGCEDCGRPTVYGMEEALLMGAIEVK